MNFLRVVSLVRSDVINENYICCILYVHAY